jgi:hypothetical protein
VALRAVLQRSNQPGGVALDVVADRGYYEGAEIMACEVAGITVTLPKPLTSGAKAAGRFGKQDFVYVAAEDVYRCPAGERLTYRCQSEEGGKTIRRYWTGTCKTCALKAQCTTGPERRISRWEHEAVLEKVQNRLDSTWIRATYAGKLVGSSGVAVRYPEPIITVRIIRAEQHLAVEHREAGWIEPGRVGAVNASDFMSTGIGAVGYPEAIVSVSIDPVEQNGLLCCHSCLPIRVRERLF